MSNSHFIHVYSGKLFDVLNPQPEDFDIRDIAHSLSQQCRFGGHCNTFYSVAAHSVVASWLCPSDLAMELLLHDAHEAYVLDLQRPLKELLPEYRLIEDEVAFALEQAFQIHPRCTENEGIVREVDLRMLATEKEQLCNPGPSWPFLEGVKPYPNRLPLWSPREAEIKFLQRYQDLKEQREEKNGAGN